MRWPWVSRGRLDDLQKRFDACDAERKELQEELVTRAERDRSNVSVEEDRAEKPATAYTTPFDRIGSRFDAARSKGPIPARFKARTR